jgi:hypothetical protein
LDFESETFVVATSVTASAGHHGHSSPRGDGGDNQVVAAGHIIPVAAPLTAGGHPNSNAPGRHREDDESFRGKSRSYDVRAGDYAGSVSATKHDAVGFYPTGGTHGVSPVLDGVPAIKNGTGLDIASGPAVAFHLTQDPINGAESPALGAGNEHGCSTIGVATFHEAQITHKANRTRVEYGRPADTLNGDPRIDDIDTRAGMAVRRLTPRERERLQGLPDDHVRWRADGSEIPDGPQYRMLGNSVAVPVLTFIARRIAAVLEGRVP